MTDNQIANIDKFIQFERGKFEQPGAGLGLSITKCLLNFMAVNSKLKIESVPQKRTIVQITLNRVNNT
jgi:K+-sensing histidine kinase KdpD